MSRWALIVLASALAIAPSSFASHRPPKGVLAPARLFPLPAEAVGRCKTLQASVRFTVLCPSRLPRAEFHLRHGAAPPRLMVDSYGDRLHPQKPGLLGLDFHYGTPVEPASGRWFWQRRTWLNRPAYFLHFTVFRRGPESLPTGLTRHCFEARCGLIKHADGYGLRPGSGFYWANHTWFFWTERRTRWAVSLHYFGRPDTTALLARLLNRLVPVRSL